MTKNTYIKDILLVKSGVSTRDGIDNPWTLYDVVDVDNWHFKTFEPMLLGKAMENGTEVELTFAEEPSQKINPKTNQPYVNRTIVSVKVAQSIPAEFEKRLARIENALKANGILE